MPPRSTPSSRRLGCWSVLVIGALSPGLALLASGAWVRSHGGGYAVLRVGGAALVLGLFVLFFIGSALRRSDPLATDPPKSPPEA